MIRARTRAGTSGWSYREWLGTLYPRGTDAGNFLKIYAENFDTVEINNTFYALPREAMIKSWADKTPPGFIFAVKAWRDIAQGQGVDPANIQKFFSAIDLLGDKLGPILFQFAPYRDVDTVWLKNLLAALPVGYRYAFELRDKRWQVDEVYDILRKHNTANCFYDLKTFRNPEVQTADFNYIRLHGPLKTPYKGGYSMERIHHYAELMKPKDGYVYFDNTMTGHAVEDARTMQILTGYTRQSAA